MHTHVYAHIRAHALLPIPLRKYTTKHNVSKALIIVNALSTEIKNSHLFGVEWEVIHWSNKEVSIQATILKDDLGLAAAHGKCT